jgi:Spy/CpxP family protein refolding chaperone
VLPNRTCAVVYSLAVFLAGAVAGALVMNLTEHFILHPARPAVEQAKKWNEADRAHYVERFKSELNLTEAQSRQLERILDETMRQYDDLHSFTHHIRQEGIMRIRAMLDDSQRKRLDDIVKKADAPLAEQQKKARKPAR